ncbi:MAG: hypothetical protein V4642_01260 [Bacteroidota bacterium]
MSRSKRKTPYVGITGMPTEKQEKRKANRKLRNKVKAQLQKGKEVLPELREVSNVWSFSKDGKIYLGDNPEIKLRK